MTPLRLVNPRVPRHTAAETLDEILASIGPGVRRHRRRSAWRARWRWAQDRSRWVTVPGLIGVACFGFWIGRGLTAVVAGLTSATTAILVTGLLFAIERQAASEERRQREASRRGGWIA